MGDDVVLGVGDVVAGHIVCAQAETLRCVFG